VRAGRSGCGTRWAWAEGLPVGLGRAMAPEPPGFRGDLSFVVSGYGLAVAKAVR